MKQVVVSIAFYHLNNSEKSIIGYQKSSKQSNSSKQILNVD